MEVVISLSDPTSVDDRIAAEALAAEHPRVVITKGTGRGPGAARNAGMRVARGSLLAFLDDDCKASAGWLQAGIDALASADLVQGRTWPTEPALYYNRTIWVDSLTGMWETCNLFVRRTIVDRAGMFDDDWAVTDPARRPWGEDCEWGWRLVRAGARSAFARDAHVAHIVEPRSFWGYLRGLTLYRNFPRILRTTPELRRQFYGGYFFDRRHVLLSGVCGVGLAGAIAAASGAKTTAAACTGAATVAYVLRLSRTPDREVKTFVKTVLVDWVEFAVLASGSLRWRRLLL
jgi:GT2 family glycosyltransferase